MAIFAKFDGVDGEATDARHEHWVNVQALDWAVGRPTGANGQSRRRGTPVVEDLALVFEYEKAAPKLLERCLQGQVIPKLEIELTASYGGNRETYLRYELTNVMVSSYRVNAVADDNDGRPTVSVANSFEEIKVTYTEFDDAGRAAGTVETSYAREKGAAQKRVAASATAAKKAKGKKRKK